MRPTTPRPGLAATLLLAAALLVGCGSETGSTGSQTASGSATPSSSPESTQSTDPSGSATPTADTPACSAVWTADATLPRGYDGCAQDGALVAQDALGCSSGQRMIRFDDRFYAVPGGLIYQTDGGLEQDRAYRKAVAICRG